MLAYLCENAVAPCIQHFISHGSLIGRPLDATTDRFNMFFSVRLCWLSNSSEVLLPQSDNLLESDKQVAEKNNTQIQRHRHFRVSCQEKGTSENKVPGFVGAFTHTHTTVRLTVCHKCVTRFYDWSWQARNDPGKNHFLDVKLHISRPPPTESMLVLFWFHNEQVL